jgi:alginate O-acetyltransferase complex protein AlgI
MLFSSIVFICLFLPLVLALYALLPRSKNNIVLVVASFVFYAWGDPLAALLLIAPSVVINFRFGLLLNAATGRRRELLAAATIGFNLLILIVFKYAGFVVDNLNALLSIVSERRLPDPDLTLPLGISFFTFHLISYLVDVYRGSVSPQKSLGAFTLYIINFPQLIAGPIIRYHQIAAQLGERPFSLSEIDAGIMRFCTGLAKKLLIANPIGELADSLFAIPPGDLQVPTVWFAVLCYALQIYFDFSGYSDMAIGLARMFGFRFPENFNYPYAATSMRDFWRRWNMTLSAWFRDYVYVPLGGNRHGQWMTARNLWIVFILTGAWHGASWSFIIWGLWNGLFLSIERLGPVQRAMALAPRAMCNAYVLVVVLVGWVFFRSPSLERALGVLLQLTPLTARGPQDVDILATISGHMLGLVALACVLAFPIWPHVSAIWRSATEGGGRLVVADIGRAAFVAVVMILSLATLTVEQSNPFIYFRF